MNLNLYTVKGDPQALTATWDRLVGELGKDEFFLHVVATQDDGIALLDVCPTEADFQGWIEGDDWRRMKAELGGDVTVTRLGEVTSAFGRDSVVEVVASRVHAH